MKYLADKQHLAPLGAVLALLLATGCDRSGTEDANAVDNTTVDNAIESPADDMGDADMDEPGTDGGDTGEIAAVPEASADLGEAEAAALDEAAAIAERIDAGEIEPSEVRGGTAWIDEGEVVRLAPGGGRVAYFRPREEAPFLLQRGESVFFITDGAAAGMLDRRGRSEELDERRGEQAARMIERATQ
ncbi:MAG: hypothetical protein H7X93_00780, partial [Sphingomonadaceae bacterium]|nr:hypothetical protein [Sphingomonadaceae bacterium]